MKKIISILSVFALLLSFSDLALAKKKHKRYSRSGSVVSDTGNLAGDAVEGTGRVAKDVTNDTGKLIRDIF